MEIITAQMKGAILSGRMSTSHIGKHSQTQSELWEEVIFNLDVFLHTREDSSTRQEGKRSCEVETLELVVRRPQAYPITVLRKRAISPPKRSKDFHHQGMREVS